MRAYLVCIQTSAWPVPSLSDTARPGLSPTVVVALQSGKHSVGLPSRLPAAAQPHEGPAAFSALACVYRSASGSLAPDLAQSKEEEQERKVQEREERKRNIS